MHPKVAAFLDAQPLTKSQILAILFPGFEKVILKYKTDLKAHHDKRINEDAADPYETYRQLADELRAKDHAEDTQAAADASKDFAEQSVQVDIDENDLS